MKVIILAGGLGTRISEETNTKPKPMVLLDDRPIIWHVMSIYAKQGFDDFVIATGYKAEVIQAWVETLETHWSIQLINTGLHTQTGGRIRIAASEFSDQTFMVTYGDGVGNINLGDLLDFHSQHGKLATVTAVHPPARFGVMQSSNGLVTDFSEKNLTNSGWINGGFFVLQRAVLEQILDDSEPFEYHALPRLVKMRELMSYEHEGFWKPMDTLREKEELSIMAKQALPPWLNGLK
jgi:glucose-1-phosphate cytidylyltransferase